MKNVSPRIVLCNGADPPQQLDQSKLITLEYREFTGSSNIELTLPNFVLDVFHLPDRILDLLEIASYVFCADRLTSRGSKDNVEYHSWSRLFHFVIKVRDYDFWSTPRCQGKTQRSTRFHVRRSSLSFYLPTWTFNASSRPV